MFRALTRWARARLTCLIAVGYLAGTLLPSAAVAFGDGSAICLEDLTGPVAAVHEHVHVHSDGTVHHHVDHGSPDAKHAANGHAPAGHPASHDADCCGLFGVAAVLPVLVDVVARSSVHHIQHPVPTDCLVGCGPDRIDRPPILSLPM